MTRYLVQFRRNSKERYWEHETMDSLYEFKELIEKIFKETKEKRLEIVINKNYSELKPK